MMEEKFLVDMAMKRKCWKEQKWKNPSEFRVLPFQNITSLSEKSGKLEDTYLDTIGFYNWN